MMPNLTKAYYESPIGLIEIVGNAAAIVSLYFIEPANKEDSPANLPPALAACLTQIDEYFKGQRQQFSLNLTPPGTEFQQSVWRQLSAIPYGKTVSYLDIANGLGNPKAVRAVGAANGQNPISIIIPCHRVIGSNGQLVGYGGGLWRKEWLLKHESGQKVEQLPLFG